MHDCEKGRKAIEEGWEEGQEWRNDITTGKGKKRIAEAEMGLESRASSSEVGAHTKEGEQKSETNFYHHLQKFTSPEANQSTPKGRSKGTICVDPACCLNRFNAPEDPDLNNTSRTFPSDNRTRFNFDAYFDQGNTSRNTANLSFTYMLRQLENVDDGYFFEFQPKITSDDPYSTSTDIILDAQSQNGRMIKLDKMMMDVEEEKARLQSERTLKRDREGWTRTQHRNINSGLMIAMIEWHNMKRKKEKKAFCEAYLRAMG